MYLQSAVRLAGPWTLNLVTSVRWAQGGSGEPLILVQGARACFMAVEQCAKKMNRARLEKEEPQAGVRDLGLSLTSGPLAAAFLTGRHFG